MHVRTGFPRFFLSRLQRCLPVHRMYEEGRKKYETKMYCYVFCLTRMFTVEIVE